MICELACAIDPSGAHRGFLVVITFKFDESHKGSRSFIVGGWIGEGRHWRKLEKQWQKAIAHENKTLPEGRKISRYHAAQMNANDGEFRGWEKEPHRKLRFTKKLIKILGRSRLSGIAVGLDLKAFLDIFPEREPSDLTTAYILCMQHLMGAIGDAIGQWPKDCRVALVHDHGDWDRWALHAYNELMANEEFKHRDRFVSMTALTWKCDVGLQAADLIAYELMRCLDDTLWTGKDMRIPLREIMQMNDHVSGFYLNREALQKFGHRIEQINETI